jgi:glycerol kinase
VWPGQDEFSKRLRVDRRFTPAMAASERDRRYGNWRRAVEAVIGYAGGQSG